MLHLMYLPSCYSNTHNREFSVRFDEHLKYLDLWWQWTIKHLITHKNKNVQSYSIIMKPEVKRNTYVEKRR